MNRVCADQGPAFFVGATNVRTGKIRVFSKDQIGTPAILASACLPTLFQAVEIDDPATGRAEAYWDGGYSGNPALFPLFDRALPDDIVIVNINPLVRDDLPVSPQEIQNRINEVSFQRLAAPGIAGDLFCTASACRRGDCPGRHETVAHSHDRG